MRRRKPYFSSAMPRLSHLSLMTPHNRRVILLEKEIEV